MSTDILELKRDALERLEEGQQLTFDQQLRLSQLGLILEMLSRMNQRIKNIEDIVDNRRLPR